MKKDNNRKTPKLKLLIKTNGIEIGRLAVNSGISPSSFRSKLSDEELYRYFSDEEYQNVITALKRHISEIKLFLANTDRKSLKTKQVTQKSKKLS